MGEHDIQREAGADAIRLFTRKLLTDLRALETMLERGLLESGVHRIGAEQELFLVGDDWRPAPRALEVLASIDDPRFTTELGLFNLEFNLDPIDLGGDCLRRMEEQLVELVDRARRGAAEAGAEVVLTGILPTLDPRDLTLDNMTPMPRYRALNDAMTRLRGRDYDLRIKGRDELMMHHDNVMLEACNTSFQVHFQVSPESFARRYNVAQAVAGPILAVATNSPLLFGRQLWRETRIALFQQSTDTRAPTAHLREDNARVHFGRDWVRESALEIFQEDLARFRVIVATEVEEDPFARLESGAAPALTALRLHNGTVYRWNRPCYGISEGKPHLRIENRVLPSGPTPLDEMANAAFWFGLMNGVAERFEDITREMSFAEAHENFVKAARLGMAAQFDWPGRPNTPAQELIGDELLPLARQGLAGLGIDSGDVDRYLEVIEARAGACRSPSQWIVDSYDGMCREAGRAECLAALTAVIVRRQKAGEPAHTWPPATLGEAGLRRRRLRRVGQIMITDLFTVNQDALVDVAAYVMDWKHIRHVPVEDNEHRLVGLVTHRSLLRLLGRRPPGSGDEAIPVSDIMQTRVITVHPETPILEAVRLMAEHRISCLPVVENDNRLVGLVTEADLIEIAREPLERFLKEDE